MGNCCAQWCPCCTVCLPPKDVRPRTVTPNVAFPGLPPNVKPHPNHIFKGNKIKTAKYTAWDFIPLNLFKQFHTWTNWFYLFIVVVNFLPGVNAFVSYLSWIPLAAVLLSTAVKDAFEDYQRTKADNKLNDSITLVYRNGQFERIEWKHVYVGDMLRVQCNDIIPADLLVLSSSDANGLCYVETANVDGETNLKQREVMRYMQDVQDFEPQRMSHYRVHIEAPNAEVYRMSGTLCRQTQADPHTNVNASMSRTQALQEHNDDKSVEDERQAPLELPCNQFPIKKENLLLRGCKLRNTDYIIGLVIYSGHETKIMMSDDGPRFKRSKLELRIQRDIIYCAVFLFLMCVSGAIGEYLWLSTFPKPNQVSYLSGIVDQYDSGTQGTITFLVLLVYLNGIVPLVLSVSQELVKMIQCYLMQNDADLYDESTGRRLACRAWNLTEDLGQIEYIFSDKTGTLTDNVMRFRRCVFNGLDYVFNDPRLDTDHQAQRVDSRKLDNNTTISDEISSNSTEVQCLSSYAEELNQLSLNSLLNLTHLNNETKQNAIVSASTNSSNGNKLPTESLSLLHHFTFMMSICNTVIVSPTNHTQQSSHAASMSESSSNSSSSNNNSPLFDAYEAESSDELALVKAACVLGCKLRQRTNNKVSVKLPGEASDVQFDVLRVLPFDSERKRMSIVVQHPVSKAIVLYCKGADSSILPLLNQQYKQTNSDVLARTKQVIDHYATVGLRTLCFAQRVLSTDEYQQWCTVYDAAERAVDNQQEKLREAMQLVERDLTLVGAVGIEDKLQEQVPETIEALRQAGIHVWMLTGDKQETAINIGHSCRLLSTSQQLLVLNESSPLETRTKLAFYLQNIQRQRADFSQQHGESNVNSKSNECNTAVFEASFVKLAKRDMDLALVIDGSTLQLVLDDTECSTQFLELARYCKSVLCCRTTPLQKGSVVKLVMEKLGKYSLAIGDGANDVSMIKTANVGVGIFGREGLQASMASDFAISRFRYLKKLLLVHGHWSYHRYAAMALAIFERETQWQTMCYWYQFFNGFSAFIMIDDIYLTVFDFLFMFFPTIYIGVLDQVLGSEALLADPSLYKFSREDLHYRPYKLWLSFLSGLWQSLVIFFLSYAMYTDNEYGAWEFGTQACFTAVTTALITMVYETCSWNAIGLACILFSYISLWMVVLMYNGLTSSITSNPPEDAYWVIFSHVQTIEFWTVQLAAVIIGVLPRSVYEIVNSYCSPSVIQIARIKQVEREQRARRETPKHQQVANENTCSQSLANHAPSRRESKVDWKRLKSIFSTTIQYDNGMPSDVRAIESAPACSSPFASHYNCNEERGLARLGDITRESDCCGNCAKSLDKVYDSGLAVELRPTCSICVDLTRSVDGKSQEQDGSIPQIDSRKSARTGKLKKNQVSPTKEVHS